MNDVAIMIIAACVYIIVVIFALKTIKIKGKKK